MYIAFCWFEPKILGGSILVYYPYSKFITHHWVGLYGPLRSLDRMKAKYIPLVNFWINWMGLCTKAST